jgi:hypothetical protein
MQHTLSCGPRSLIHHITLESISAQPRGHFKQTIAQSNARSFLCIVSHSPCPLHFGIGSMRAFSDSEKNLILRAHAYFLGEASAKRDPEGRDVRARVAACLGIGKATVARFVAAANKRKKPGEDRRRSAAEEPTRGVVEIYREIFEDVITSRNLQLRESTMVSVASFSTERSTTSVSRIRRRARARTSPSMSAGSCDRVCLRQCR